MNKQELTPEEQVELTEVMNKINEILGDKYVFGVDWVPKISVGFKPKE